MNCPKVLWYFRPGTNRKGCTKSPLKDWSLNNWSYNLQKKRKWKRLKTNKLWLFQILFQTLFSVAILRKQDHFSLGLNDKNSRHLTLMFQVQNGKERKRSLKVRCKNSIFKSINPIKSLKTISLKTFSEFSACSDFHNFREWKHP